MPNTGQADPAAPRRPAAGAAGAPIGTIEVARCDDVAVSVRGTPVLLGTLGANSSGKTTLLQVLATLVTPSAGRGHVLGQALGVPGVQMVRPRIALVGHHPALYGSLTLGSAGGGPLRPPPVGRRPTRCWPGSWTP